MLPRWCVTLALARLTHHGVQELGAGGAGAAEEAAVGYQVLVCVHRVLHVHAADQAAVVLAIVGTGQMHPIVPLDEKKQNKSKLVSCVGLERKCNLQLGLGRGHGVKLINYTEGRHQECYEDHERGKGYALLRESCSRKWVITFMFILTGVDDRTAPSEACAPKRNPHLNDQVARGVPGHLGELGDELPEARPAVGINHPAC